MNTKGSILVINPMFVVCAVRLSLVVLTWRDIIHAGQLHLLCEVCSKAFTEAGKLKEIKDDPHTPFVCDVRSMTFTSSRNLKRGKRVRIGYKPFPCEVCSKAFADTVDLKRHKMVYSGHESFVFDVCSKGFTWPIGFHWCPWCEETQEGSHPCNWKYKACTALTELMPQEVTHLPCDGAPIWLEW